MAKKQDLNLRRDHRSDGIPKPRRLRELPLYLLKRIKGFLYRLFYIIGLVWESSPAVLFAMAFFCIADGFLPVIGAYISKDLLNAIASLITDAPEPSASIIKNITELLRPILFLLILQFVYLFGKRILERLNHTVTAIAGELVTNHIKLKIINKAKSVDMASFDSPDFYEKLENANREAGMRPIGILTSTFNVISASISIVSFILVLAALSPMAPLVIIFAALPGALVNYFSRKKSFRYIRARSKERREMNYFSGMMTNKDSAKEVKLLGLSDTFIAKYENAFGRYYKGLKKLIMRENAFRILVGFISTLASCALFMYVAYDVVFSGGLIGDYSLYSGALTSVSSYVSVLVTATASIYEGTLFIDNMIEYMKEPSRIVSSLDEPKLPEVGAPHRIVFENVSFSYPGTERRVIDNFDLTIEAGESVVLVGLNGAGKTTLIKLLTRLYDPTEGRITLDGVDLREYDPKALYDLFGIIFQDFGKYAVTAEENIGYGDIGRIGESEAIESAASSADADGFISELPLGYGTPLTRIFEEDGIELSGGQWQKLSVARAFFKKSDILILDEPTAALDALAEQEIFNQFSELAEGKISIFVSHRLSSAVTAKKIVVINGGKLSEVGTHAELMARGGEYALLFTTQAARYISSCR